MNDLLGDALPVVRKNDRPEAAALKEVLLAELHRQRRLKHYDGMILLELIEKHSAAEFSTIEKDTK